MSEHLPDGRIDRVATLLTRPTAPGGVPFLLSFGSFTAVLLLCAVTHYPFWIGLLLPIWGLLKWKCSGDLHLGSTMLGWVSGAGKTVNPFAWGGSTVAPLAKSKAFGMRNHG